METEKRDDMVSKENQQKERSTEKLLMGGNCNAF